MLFRALEDDFSRNLYLDAYKIDWAGRSASKFQHRIKTFFHTYWGDPNTFSWFEEIPLVGELSQLRIDFLCKFKEGGKDKLVFAEADGIFHIKRNTHFAPTEEDYLSSIERDSCKFLYCQKNKIPLLRIYEDDEPLTPEWFNQTFNYPFGI